MRPLSAIAVAALLAASGSISVAQTPLDAGGSSFRVLETTIGDVHTAFRSGQLTCRGLVEAYVKRIQAYDKQGPALNAVQIINPHAVADAIALDAAFRASGPVGPLHCVPVLMKDEVETNDMPTTYGSAVFKDFVPRRNATIVTKLKQAGAVIVAKTNMGEFARGYVGSAFGVIRNPYDPRRHASGSSGGTGAAVAANFGLVGIGEDTGGSIRGPAAVASLVGLRPTVPLVSRFGMMPAKPTQDTLGPITRTVRDTAVLLDAIAGYDPNDSITAYSAGQVPPTYTAFLDANGLKGARLGIIREPQDPKTDVNSEDYKKVRAVMDKALADLKGLGADLVEVKIPEMQARLKQMSDDNVYETERATNAYLADHPNAPAKTLRDIVLSGKVAPIRARSLMDNVGKTTDQPEYLRVLTAKEETRQLVLKIMADNRLDALIYATFDHQPAIIPDGIATDPNITDASTLGTNRNLAPSLALPALTVPAGFTTDGLPVGLEFMGRAFSEPALLKLGYAYEQGTHNRKPPASSPALTGEP